MALQVRYGAFTQDGHEAVGGMILMLKGANSDKVVTAVKERDERSSKVASIRYRIKTISRSFQPDRTHDKHYFTQSDRRCAYCYFVLVLLLGSVRGGLITASVIPLSLLFAFILMKIFGVWANLIRALVL